MLGFGDLDRRCTLENFHFAPLVLVLDPGSGIGRSEEAIAEYS